MSIYQNEYATSLFFEIKHCEYKTGVFDQLDYAIEDWERLACEVLRHDPPSNPTRSRDDQET